MITTSIPDLRFGWMRRYDVSWVEVLFCCAVIAGLATIPTPTRVAAVVELTPWAAGHSVVVLSGALLLVVVAVYRWATVWGPVRVDRATLRWKLSGPASRSSHLRRATGPVVAGTIGVTALAGAVLGLLDVSVLVYLLPAGAVGGVLAVAAAYRRQVRVDRERYPVMTPSSCGHPVHSLHRNTIAPVDGYAGALSLALSMMDTDWIARARTVRWQFTHHASRVRGLAHDRPWAFVQLDVRRLRRHPDALTRALTAVAVSAVLPSVVTIHIGATVVIAALGMITARSMAGGLRSAAQNPGVARMLGIADRDLRLPHLLLPASASALYAIAALIFWDLGSVGPLIVWVGTTAAAYRHATRPDLPYDAPVMVDSLLTGAAFAPQLLLTQLRGYGILAATALAMSLVC